MIEALLVAILGTAVGGLLAHESSALLCQLSRALLDRRLRQLLSQSPPEVGDRMREKIEADFEPYSNRPLAGFLFAICLREEGPRRPIRRRLASLSEWLGNMVDELIEERKRGRHLLLCPVTVGMSPGLAGARVLLEMERRR